MKDKSTQHEYGTLIPIDFTYSPPHHPTNTTSTTSSSQTETYTFLPKAMNKFYNETEKDGQHINANVVRIQLGSNNTNSNKSSNGICLSKDVRSSVSEASSSIPSSYEKHSGIRNQAQPIQLENQAGFPHIESKPIADLSKSKEMGTYSVKDDGVPPLTKPFKIPILPSSSPSHNRGRRGGIIPKESDAIQHAAATMDKPLHPVLTIPPPPSSMDVMNYPIPTSVIQQPFSPNSYNVFVPSSSMIINGHNTLEELELNSRRIPRSDGSINAQLQQMPDSIIRVSISTPSS